MPHTGTLAIVAASAMAGVPLLNGFLSKEMFFAEALALRHLRRPRRACDRRGRPGRRVQRRVLRALRPRRVLQRRAARPAEPAPRGAPLHEGAGRGAGHGVRRGRPPARADRRAAGHLAARAVFGADSAAVLGRALARIHRPAATQRAGVRGRRAASTGPCNASTISTCTCHRGGARAGCSYPPRRLHERRGARRRRARQRIAAALPGAAVRASAWSSSAVPAPRRRHRPRVTRARSAHAARGRGGTRARGGRARRAWSGTASGSWPSSSRARRARGVDRLPLLLRAGPRADPARRRGGHDRADAYGPRAAAAIDARGSPRCGARHAMPSSPGSLAPASAASRWRR